MTTENTPKVITPAHLEKAINYTDYVALTEQLLAENKTTGTNHAEDLVEYTRMNLHRKRRGEKSAVLTEEMLQTLQKVERKMVWVVLTEAWCGDAAHNIPFMELAARENPMISISYELRDSAPFRIENYLTRGTKSIPKLVIQDAEGKDMATWGPRPADSQELYSRLLEEKADFDKMKTALQQWYNSNKGLDTQKELAGLLRGIAV